MDALEDEDVWFEKINLLRKLHDMIDGKIKDLSDENFSRNCLAKNEWIKIMQLIKQSEQAKEVVFKPKNPKLSLKKKNVR